ncbi:MAG: aquaporin [Verrucomicrobiales bacterium]|nr:aquaporin [Verrucomicrobiales bacterium]
MRRHWPEYFTEAAGLGLFMISACTFSALLFHPASPAAGAITDGLARRTLMGIAMALTAIVLIYSPWGQQSGAHFNPAVTLTFLRLGKIDPRDAAGYVAAQFLGGLSGVFLATRGLAPWIGHPEVNFAVTLPGLRGVEVAWMAEFILAFLLMTVVLTISNTPRIARFTGIGAAACVFLFITFEAPLSGMSLNPARTFASALAARNWTALWVYFTAPPAGMLAAAAVFRRIQGADAISCAKLHHQNPRRCIFCEFQAAKESRNRVRFAPGVRPSEV